MGYQKRLKRLKKRYKKRIRRLLKSVRSMVVVRTKVDGPFPCHDDGFKWTLVIYPEGYAEDGQEAPPKDALTVTFSIAEEKEHEGTGDGVNFTVDITTIEGVMLGGIYPFNYTDRCWVAIRNKESVEERFKMLDDVAVGEILYAVEKWAGA